MPCCGKVREALRSSLAINKSNGDAVARHGHARILSSPAGSSKQSGSKPVFEYVGATAMTVSLVDSGRRYHFPHSGARIEVEAEDVAALVAVPRLRALDI